MSSNRAMHRRSRTDGIQSDLLRTMLPFMVKRRDSFVYYLHTSHKAILYASTDVPTIVCYTRMEQTMTKKSVMPRAHWLRLVPFGKLFRISEFQELWLMSVCENYLSLAGEEKYVRVFTQAYPTCLRNSWSSPTRTWPAKLGYSQTIFNVRSDPFMPCRRS